MGSIFLSCPNKRPSIIYIILDFIVQVDIDPDDNLDSEDQDQDDDEGK